MQLFEATRGWGLIDHNLVAADTGGQHRPPACAPSCRGGRAQRLAAGAGLDRRARMGRHDPVRGRCRARSTRPRGFIVTANNRVVADRSTADYLFTDCHPPYRARRVEDAAAELTGATRRGHAGHLIATCGACAPAVPGARSPRPTAGAVRRAARADRGLGRATWAADSPAAAAYTAVPLGAGGRAAERSGLGAAARRPDRRPDSAPGWSPATSSGGHFRGSSAADDASPAGRLRPGTQAVRRGAAPRGRTRATAPPGAMLHRRALPSAPARFPGEARPARPRRRAARRRQRHRARHRLLRGRRGTRPPTARVARYVFDVGAWDDSSWVVVTGASGDPDDPHYLDQHEVWAAGETVPMRYDWTAIAATGQLTVLRPTAD